MNERLVIRVLCIAAVVTIVGVATFASCGPVNHSNVCIANTPDTVFVPPKGFKPGVLPTPGYCPRTCGLGQPCKNCCDNYFPVPPAKAGQAAQCYDTEGCDPSQR